MRAAVVALGLAAAGLVSSPPVAGQPKVVEPEVVPPRYGQAFSPKAYPQGTAREVVASAILAVEKNDFATARAVNARLLPSFAYMNDDECVFSQATKVAMNELGLEVGECRLPLGPAPSGTDAAARSVLADLGYEV